MKPHQKARKSRKCGLRTRVPDIATRVPRKSHMDWENTETPVFGRLDLVFPKFALVTRRWSFSALIRVRRVFAIFTHFTHATVKSTSKKRRRRARIDAENDHRRVTRPRLRIIVNVKETRGYPTGHLRDPSDAIECNRESRKVFGYTSGSRNGLWIQRGDKRKKSFWGGHFSHFGRAWP